MKKVLFSICIFLLILNVSNAQSIRKNYLEMTDYEKSELIDSFYDIRSNPTIPLSTILWTVFLMPFFGLKSLLAMDALVRTRPYRRLFDCNLNSRRNYTMPGPVQVFQKPQRYLSAFWSAQKPSGF